jgi:hypothetical protein
MMSIGERLIRWIAPDLYSKIEILVVLHQTVISQCQEKAKRRTEG